MGDEHVRDPRHTSDKRNRAGRSGSPPPCLVLGLSADTIAPLGRSSTTPEEAPAHWAPALVPGAPRERDLALVLSTAAGRTRWMTSRTTR